MSEIMVSIVCNTYNQESYIRDALDGFIMQKTSFPVEILVHDDASTDSTAQIIREYVAKYPELIKPILQTENQYSKNVSISKAFQFSRAKGKYIAFCEGDDYWTDPLKLQKQVEAMERHPEVDICAHQMKIICSGKTTGLVPQQAEDRIFSVEDVITGGGGFVMTASLMFRRELFVHEYAFAKMMSIDYIWQVSGALRGGMLYLGDCMGVYRQQAQGSWSVRMEKNPEAHIKTWQKIRDTLEAMNVETDYKYASAINTQIAMMDLNVWTRRGQWTKILSSKGREMLWLQPPKQRVIILLQAMRRCVLNKVGHYNS